MAVERSAHAAEQLVAPREDTIMGAGLAFQQFSFFLAACLLIETDEKWNLMNRYVPRSTASRHSPVGCTLIFGLIFLCVGIGLAGFAGVKLLPRALEVKGWRATPCEVTHWAVQVIPDESAVYKVAVEVRYTYDFEGQRHEGTVYDALNARDPKINEAEEEGVKARQGPALCYVNPDEPSEASFRPASFWLSGGLIAGGVMLAFLGGGIASSALLKLGRKLVSPSGGAPRSGCVGALVLPIAGLLFVGAAALVWKLALYDRLDGSALESRLKATPARVIASGTHATKSGNHQARPSSKRKYRPKIAYQYEFAGRTWHSDWLDFDPHSVTSSRRQAEEAASRYPVDKIVTCWVNPDAPWQAVLEKRQTSPIWLWLIVLLFGGVGFAAVGWGILRAVRRMVTPGAP